MRSPLKEGHEKSNDSIAAAKAWAEFKKGYMSRKEHPARPGEPISAQENQDEYDREKNEFYYDVERGKLRLIPTDDAEQQDRSGIKDWQLAPSMKEDRKPRPAPKQPPLGGLKRPPMSESEKRRMHATQSITDKAIKEQDYQGQVGIDLGTIKKKSALNMLGISSPLNKISGPCKAAAKRKFKVWPSAYASGWGVRCTKAGGPSNYGGGKKK